MRWWSRYWCAEGGRLSVAVLRIAIAIGVWLALADLQQGWPANAPGAPQPPDVYRPVGIWMLFGASVPSNALIDLLWIGAKVSTVAMALGIVSRVSTAVSLGFALLLTSLVYSASTTWSHSYNVVMLAHIAFLGARCGDTLSVDALIRRRRGLPPLEAPNGYQWSIRLVQIAVVVMFASGAFHKLIQGRFTLDWALSDNLRNQILVRFDLAGQPRTAIADWLVDNPWKYKTAALLNLVSQLLPVATVFLVKRPVLRAMVGTLFVVETLALGLVMDLWNVQWLPLAAVFVDWEALLGRRALPPTEVTQVTSGRTTWRARHVFVAVFVVYDLATAFIPRIDQRLNTYPFSSFPMFASIRATKPYGEHLPYSMALGHFEVLSADPVSSYVHPWLDHSYRRTFSVRDADDLRKRLAAIVVDARHWHGTIDRLRCWYSVFELPAYPAPATPIRRPIALIGESQPDGSVRSMLRKPRTVAGELELDGGPGAWDRLEVYENERATPTQTITGGSPWRLARPKARKVAFVGVMRDGGVEQRWLIATLPR